MRGTTRGGLRDRNFSMLIAKSITCEARWRVRYQRALHSGSAEFGSAGKVVR